MVVCGSHRLVLLCTQYPFTTDPIDRPVEFVPTKQAYNPRDMLAGRANPDDPSRWEAGFFDKNTWMETMVRGPAACGACLCPVRCSGVSINCTYVCAYT